MLLPDSTQENLLACWNFIKNYYKQRSCKNRYRSVAKLSTFVRKSGVIKMRGKASELKGLCLPLLKLWKAHMNASLDVHKKIKLMLQFNCQMETILDTYADCFKLPEDTANQFLKCGFVMYQLQTDLRNHFEMDEDCTKKLFSVTAKAHMVMHSCLLAGNISPRVLWCFMGEDFMRKVQRLAESCVRGVRNTNVYNKHMDALCG